MESQVKSECRDRRGVLWSREICQLSNSKSSYESALCLRSLFKILQTIDETDRVKYCKRDFENVVSNISHDKLIWNEDIVKLATELHITFFHKCPLNKITPDLLIEIFLWVPIDEFATVFSICKSWNKIATSDHLWCFFYKYRFLRHNMSGILHIQELPYIKEFQRRLADPHIGDKVEVAWRGKFRLEASEVYQGLAWWVAEVVDKHSSQSKYKIKYPGWDNRWDEWVPRCRLRWAVEKNEIEQIRIHDCVEIWCCGATVPGAWLESYVTDIRENQYCVGNVLTSGDLWVDRHRLRLVKHTHTTAVSLLPDLITHESIVLHDHGDGGGEGGEHQHPLLGHPMLSARSLVLRTLSISRLHVPGTLSTRSLGSQPGTPTSQRNTIINDNNNHSPTTTTTMANTRTPRQVDMLFDDQRLPVTPRHSEQAVCNIM